MCEMGYVNVLSVFSVQFWLESGSICKNSDHSCLFHYINTCWVPLVMFEYLAKQPHVQTVSFETRQMLMQEITCVIPIILQDDLNKIIYSKCYKILITSCLLKSSRQTVQTQIRLLLKKQSDQGLPCFLLSEAFCKNKIFT